MRDFTRPGVFEHGFEPARRRCPRQIRTTQPYADATLTHPRAVNERRLNRRIPPQ